MLVALGWALLFSAPLQDMMGRTGVNMVVVSQCTIISGFGLAVLGALQSGFGALSRFFDSILERTAKPPLPFATATAAHVQEPRPVPKNAAPKKKVLERGWLKDRAYVIFVDGSVEIETLLGLRRFASLRDAQEFVG